MKIGFNMLLWTPFVTEDHFHLFEKLKAAGYDGIELEILEGDPAHYQRVAQVLRDNGLQSTAVTIIPDPAHSPISPVAAHRQGAVDHLTWAIECTAALQADLLCGPFYQPLGVFSGQGPTAEEKERAAEVHRAIADIAQEAGIVLAIEPLNRFEAYLLNTVGDAAAYVRHVGHPNLSVLYDSFHANIEERDPVACITAHMDVIRHVNIS
jgi:D-psicose/D-tagatose/L-ribulose 3-epimerase